MEEKEMEGRTDPSTLKDMLKGKKLEIANCEAISQTPLLEEELDQCNAKNGCVERGGTEK